VIQRHFLPLPDHAWDDDSLGDQLGLEPADVVAALGKRRSSPTKPGDARSSVQPKYRNPENPSQTWAGRGAKPAWIELGSDKKPLPKFRIPDVAA